MSDWSVRALERLQEAGAAAARRGRYLLACIRRRTPIILRASGWFYHLCLAHTRRFIYRVYFHGEVLFLWTLDRLGQHLPILRRRLTRLYWLWLGRAWRFSYRIYFHLHVLLVRILDRLGYHLPILWRRLTRLYWLWLGRAWRFSYRIWFRSIVLGIWVYGRLRYYTPLFLRYLRNRSLTAGRHGRSLLGRLVRAVAGMVNAVLQASIDTVTLLLRTSRGLLLAAGRLLGQVTRWSLARLRFLARESARGGTWLWRHTAVISAYIAERLYQYALLMRLNKPIGMLLLLWPTLWALWIAAEGMPDLAILGIFVAGVVLTRSAGCVMNDFADRAFDAHVSRTRQRPLATGKVTPREALLVAALLALCALWLVLQLNLLTVALAVVAVVLAVIYPFTKRRTYVPQFFLGLAFGWAAPMAFAAQTGTVPPIAWVLLMITVLWALVYDTLYAMVDREEDIALGIKSTAILFEEADRVIIGIIQLLVVLALLLIGTRLDFNHYYYAGLAIAALLFVYQQYLIRDRYPVQCFLAFLNNNWVGAVVFGGIALNYYHG